MYLGQSFSLSLAALVAVAMSPSSGWGLQSGQAQAEDGGWIVVSAPQVDLWYHGMAVVGFDHGNESSIYSSDYVDRVRAEKERLGIYPTALDLAADDLRTELELDDAFRSLHFLPLHFVDATPRRMLHALATIADRNTSDNGALGLDTGVGLGFTVNAIRSEGQLDVLGRFVSALQEEWRVFFDAYWNETVQPDFAAHSELQNEWDAQAGDALRGFLTSRAMAEGLIFVSPALGQNGRLVQANALEGLNNAVAVWSPRGPSNGAIISAAVREMCFTVVDRRVLVAGVRSGMDPQVVGSRGSVRCGAMLFEAHNPAFLPEYERTFLRIAGGDVEDGDLTDAFERAYDVDERVISALQRHIDPGARVSDQDRVPAPSWIVRARPQLDLWYHALATIGIENEQVLPKYNPDYAAEMTRIKRDLGMFPTPLDSMSDYFRSRLESSSEVEFFDKAPLYFPTASPEEMLSALEAVADRRAYQPDRLVPAVRIGAILATQVFQSGSSRRVLKRFVTTLRQEWDVFYRDYWHENIHADSAERAALDEFWTTMVAPGLEAFLQRLRLDGGDIVVSPSVGPEGRLWEGDPMGREDNQIVVWNPSDVGPRDPAYNVVKEACYALVDQMVEDLVEDRKEIADVRMNAAVRCGALVLDRYAPIMSAGYRRAMMRSVSADSVTATVSRFEERFQLEPNVLEALRSEVWKRN